MLTRRKTARKRVDTTRTVDKSPLSRDRRPKARMDNKRLTYFRENIGRSRTRQSDALVTEQNERVNDVDAREPLATTFGYFVLLSFVLFHWIYHGKI